MNELDGFWAGMARTADRVAWKTIMRDNRAVIRALAAGEASMAAVHEPGFVEFFDRHAQPLHTQGVPITMVDPRYPACLLALKDPPPVLFCEGDLSCLERQMVAVVGTRRCTPYGAAVARHLGGGLAAAGASVVSGLARGIDAHAHRAALRAGRTIAVLAHGLAHTAPGSHRSLRRDILDAGGLLVTDLPDEVEPAPFRFPRRNKWIAGLSEHVVVVEAPAKSGALHTVRDARAIGRQTWVVPGQLGIAATKGSLGFLAEDPEGGKPPKVIVDVDGFVAQVTDTEASEGEEWLQLLLAGATVSEVSRVTGMPLTDLLVEIGEREVRGELVRMPGQRYGAGASVR